MGDGGLGLLLQDPILLLLVVRKQEQEEVKCKDLNLDVLECNFIITVTFYFLFFGNVMKILNLVRCKTVGNLQNIHMNLSQNHLLTLGYLQSLCGPKFIFSFN